MTSNPDYSYQNQAVKNIATDFLKNPSLKTLLVIPTGGGKTRTAVKSILKLHDEQFFSVDADQILWVAHRQELLKQAEDAFKDENSHPAAAKALARTLFQSNVPASQEILKNDNIKLVVIDEAHHSAAATYLPLFRPNVGVLGLTATPSRHDGAPLEFERESFSVGFPDLERLGVVLKPTVIQLEGIASDIKDFTEKELEKLNSNARNEIIRDALIARQDHLIKVIVYVGAKQHAKDLYECLQNSDLKTSYESISYVLGGDGNNSRGQPRNTFFEQEKSYSRSIIVNVQVLTEGYDDQKVNAVVMAAPFRSKLQYMQCMGRAVRRDPNNTKKKAYVVELVEDLPNIQYRIDNRWIYSEISDLLEPAIIDLQYSTIAEINSELSVLYQSNAVPKERQQFVNSEDAERPQLLLFRTLTPSHEIAHEPVLLTGSNRRAVQNWYNFLSTKIALGRLQNVNRTQAMNMVQEWLSSDLASPLVRANILDAMKNSLEHPSSSSPWLTLVIFKKIPQIINDDLDAFLRDAINGPEILAQVSEAGSTMGLSVFKFPLPTRGYVARLVHATQADEIDALLDNIRILKESIDEQIFGIHRLLISTTISLEPYLLDCLPRIVRESTNYRFDFN